MSKDLLIFGAVVFVGLYLLHRSSTAGTATAGNSTSVATGNAAGGMTGSQQLVMNATDQVFNTVNTLLTGSTN